MENFENELKTFISEKLPQYLPNLEIIKSNERFLSGLLLGKEDDFSMVLITPSRIISVSKEETLIFYIENISNVKIKNLANNELFINVELQFNQGNLGFNVSKTYQLTDFFLHVLLGILPSFKRALTLPQQEPQKNKIGFDISGTLDSN